MTNKDRFEMEGFNLYMFYTFNLRKQMLKKITEEREENKYKKWIKHTTSGKFIKY